MTIFARPIVGCAILLLAVNAAGAEGTSSLTATLQVLETSSVASPVASRESLSASETARVVGDLPQVRVSTTGPETLVVNEPAKYVISLDNLGAHAAEKINVRCALPAWVELGEHVASAGKLTEAQPDIVWHVEHIDGGDHQELTLNLVPRAGKAFDLNVDISVQPSNVQKRIAVQQPKLDLLLKGPDSVSFNQPSVWDLKVSNPGTGDLNNVSVEVFAGDVKVASQTLARVPAGGVQPIVLQVNPTEAGTHSVRVVGKAGRLSHEVESSFLVRRGQVAVALRGAPRGFAGAASKYDVQLFNDGDDDVKNVLVSLNLPENVEYLSGIENPSFTTSGLSWVVNRVGVGQSKSFTVSLMAKKGGLHDLEATASTMDRMNARDELAFEAITAPDIRLEVIDPVGPQSLDAVVEYTIRILNHGSDSAKEISVIAVCDSNLEPVDVSGNAALRDGKVYFKPTPTLEPNHKITLKVKAKAKRSGSHDFRVIVKSVVPETRLAVQETTRFFDVSGREAELETAEVDPDDKVAAEQKVPRRSLLQPLSFEPQFRASKLPGKVVR